MLSTATKEILVVAMANRTAAAELSQAVDDAGQGLVSLVQTIDNGDTTHAPSGDAVYDALALKRDTAFTPTTGGDWSPAPTTIQEALDQLAARVAALEP